MDIRTLHCFRQVYEKRSINSAAKELFISAQGLGKMINNLEEELKTSLFERSAKGLVPTENADLLYDQSADLITRFRQIEQAIEQARTKAKRLRICSARGVLNALSFEVLANFIENHPEIELEWKEMANADVKATVNSHAAEIGLVVGETLQEEIQERHLQSRKMCVLVYKGHPYYDRTELSIADLGDEKIITLNDQYRVYHDFVKACKTAQVQPRITGLTEDSHFVYKMCKQKIGLGILLDFSTSDFNLQNIKVLPLKEKISWDIYMIYLKKNKKYPNIALFDSYIKKIFS
ncbi:MAG: LysR family transcriptional regulator [Lachnospiraceae bacterium]